MSTRSGAVPIEVLREAAAERSAATSVRSVAEQIGITHRSLQLVLDGSVPYTANRRKLENWYVRESAGQSVSDTDTATAALAVLTRGLPPREQKALLEQAEKLWRESYERAGVPQPRWLAAFRRGA